ncbi:MAG: hypothetical protein MZV63_40800 [Marinilabiliales bacterium]|nr:hypothetical protein [Marinilabiliales bacterium]
MSRSNTWMWRWSPAAVWHYHETSNDQTLFLYLIDGTLAADEALAEL